MKLYLVWSFLLLAALTCPSIRAEEEDDQVEDTTLGTQVDIYDFPSMAQVEIRVGTIWVQQCAATVLTSRHVLSTATCFYGELYLRENRRIRAGTSDRGQGGEVAFITREFNHPDFGLRGADSDITVVRLETPFTLSASIQQIPIVAEGLALPIGLPVGLVGWGNTAQGAETIDNNLYSLGLYIYNFERCVETYSELEEPETVTKNMICAGISSDSGRDLDSRDVGAPLLYQNIQVGVVSFGEANSNNTIPLVSTAVSSFTQWIVDIAIF